MHSLLMNYIPARGFHAVSDLGQMKPCDSQVMMLLTSVFNLCQHFEISYSRYANTHFITGVYKTINDSYS